MNRGHCEEPRNMDPFVDVSSVLFNSAEEFGMLVIKSRHNSELF